MLEGASYGTARVSAGILTSESRSGAPRNLEPNCGCGQRGCLRPSKRGSKPASGTA
jgi:hypothetical protein